MLLEFALILLLVGAGAHSPHQTAPILPEYSVFGNSSSEGNFTIRPHTIHMFQINYHLHHPFEISVSSNTTARVYIENCQIEENLVTESGESTKLKWPPEEQCLSRERFIFMFQSKDYASVRITFRTITSGDLHQDPIEPDYFKDGIEEWSLKMFLSRFFGAFP